MVDSLAAFAAPDWHLSKSPLFQARKLCRRHWMPFDCSLPGRQQLHSKHRLRGKGCTLNLSTSTWLALPILWKSRRVMRGSSQKAILGASSEVQDTHASQRVAVITGGTSRLGAATAVGLARSGKYDKVVIIGRDESKAKSIIEELQSTDVQPHSSKPTLQIWTKFVLSVLR